MQWLVIKQGRNKLGDKPIKPPSGESEKNKSSDSKVFYVIPDTDEAIEDLLDAICGPEEKDEAEAYTSSTSSALSRALAELKAQGLFVCPLCVAVCV